MNEPVRDPLHEALSAALTNAQSARFTVGELNLSAALASPYWEFNSAATARLNELAAPLVDLLLSDARFPGNRVLYMRSDNGASGFYPNFVGIPLLRRAYKTGSPEEAINWLKKILETKIATGRTVQTIWGVPIKSPLTLTPDITLTPTSLLPNSAQKRWIENSAHFQMQSPITTMLGWTPPESALIIERRIDPLLFDPARPAETIGDTFLQTNELLLDVTRVLTVIGPRVAIPAAQWFNFDDADIEEASLMAGSRRSQLLEVLPKPAKTHAPFDELEAPKVVQNFLALRGKTRDKIRVALDRLNQAQRRHGIGDRALELCIALEALAGDDAKSEMTHKVRVRAVRLIGGNPEKRQRNSIIIKSAYETRSKLVHSGHVNPQGTKTIAGEKLSLEDIIDNAIKLCAELIKALIARGAIPDWSHFDTCEHIEE